MHSSNTLYCWCVYRTVFCSRRSSGPMEQVMLLALMTQSTTGRLQSSWAGCTMRVQLKTPYWWIVDGELKPLETTRLEEIGINLQKRLHFDISRIYKNCLFVNDTGSVLATSFPTSGRVATPFSMAHGATTGLKERTGFTTPLNWSTSLSLQSVVTGTFCWISDRRLMAASCLLLKSGSWRWGSGLRSATLTLASYLQK